MSTQVGNLILRLQADISEVRGQLQRMEGDFRTTFGKIDGVARTLSRTLGVTLGAGGIAGLGASLVALGRNAAFTCTIHHISQSVVSLYS